MSVWKLCSAGLVPPRRRAEAALRTSPVTAVTLVALVAGLPPMLYLLGRSAAPELGTALGEDRALASGFALGLGLSALLAGVLVATLAPGRRALGAQLEAAPVAHLTHFLALTAAPLALALALAAAVVSPALVPVAGALAAGPIAAPVLLAGAAAGVLLGAALGEGLRAVRSDLVRGTAVLAGVAGLWAAGGRLAGRGLLGGPFGSVATLAERSGEAAEALAILGVTALGGLVLWAVAGARRPAEARSSDVARALLPIAGRPCPAVFYAGLKVLGRRSELRRHGVSVVVLAGAGSASLGRLAPGTPPLAIVGLAGLVGALGAAIVPLAATGIARESAWLWRTAPEPAGRGAVAWAVAALLAGLAVWGLALVPASVVARASVETYLAFAGVALGTGSTALVAGTVVPWRTDRLGDQLASYAAMGVLAGALWLALGRVGGWAARAGVPEGRLAAASVVLLVAAALAVTGALADGRKPR